MFNISLRFHAFYQPFKAPFTKYPNPFSYGFCADSYSFSNLLGTGAFKIHYNYFGPIVARYAFGCLVKFINIKIISKHGITLSSALINMQA